MRSPSGISTRVATIPQPSASTVAGSSARTDHPSTNAKRAGRYRSDVTATAVSARRCGRDALRMRQTKTIRTPAMIASSAYVLTSVTAATSPGAGVSRSTFSGQGPSQRPSGPPPSSAGENSRNAE